MAVTVEEAFDSLTLEERWSLLEKHFHFVRPQEIIQEDDKNYQYRFLFYDIALQLASIFNTRTRRFNEAVSIPANAGEQKFPQKKKPPAKPPKRRKKK